MGMQEPGQQLRKRLLERAKGAIREKASNPELQAIKAVNLFGDLEVVFNLLAEQAIEWHSLHFPEMGREVRDNPLYLKLVALGDKKNFSETEILKLTTDAGLAKALSQKAISSMGAPFSQKDIGQVKSLAVLALNAKQEMSGLSSYIDSSMKEIAPNFSSVAGSILGARLLAKAGSLRRLALMPSSTMQILGAEKALFRHIKTGAKPPKHGLILQHPSVRKAERNEKGKAAKRLAAELSLAARKDFFAEKKIA